MRRILTAFMTILFLLSLCHPVLTSSTDPKISFDTGDCDLSYGVKVRVKYEASVSINKPSSAQPGEKTKWDVQLTGGTLSISVYVPSPIDKWYSFSKSVPIGSYVDIPVATGISTRVKILASASLSEHGPCSLGKSSLSWDSEGTKSISVNVDSEAKSGEKVTIDFNFKFPVYIGVVIDLFLFKKEIASRNIGSFDANPTLTESMSIGTPPSPIPLHIIVIVIAIICVISIVYVVYRSQMKSEKRSE